MAYYQLSFPRSGASWTRYISRTFLNIDRRYDHNDNAGSVYYKTHGNDIKELRDKQRQMVFLLRNFKECVQRHYHNFNENGIKHYVTLLNIYDTWPANKILIFYEDLITRPNIEIPRLAKFLNKDYMDIYYFLKRYDYHWEFSRNSYGLCETDSKSTIFHSKSIDITQWDNYILSIMPDSLLKYIKRYL